MVSSVGKTNVTKRWWCWVCLDHHEFYFQLPAFFPVEPVWVSFWALCYIQVDAKFSFYQIKKQSPCQWFSHVAAMAMSVQAIYRRLVLIGLHHKLPCLKTWTRNCPLIWPAHLSRKAVLNCDQGSYVVSKTRKPYTVKMYPALWINIFTGLMSEYLWLAF